MQIDGNKVIDVLSKRYGVKLAEQNRETAFLVAENETLKEEIQRLQKELNDYKEKDKEKESNNTK